MPKQTDWLCNISKERFSNLLITDSKNAKTNRFVVQSFQWKVFAFGEFFAV
jgi:hypothetical protein